MKKIFLLLFVLGFFLLSAYFIYPFALRAVFIVSGSVEITSEIAERAAKPNTMLFLVAKNESGVPTAVKKIINPIFPLDFKMTPSDLIMPDILTKKVYLEAFINSHGELGIFRIGDFKGSMPRPIFIFSKNNRILIDTPGK